MLQNLEMEEKLGAFQIFAGSNELQIIF